MKKFFYYVSERKLTIGNAALILAVTSFFSNVLGLYRERLIACKFGASHVTDIFFASFRLPDLIFNLLVLGALSSAFIPVFVDHLVKKKDSKDAWYVANSFLNFLLISTIIFSIVIFIATPKLVPFLLPGFFSGRNGADFNVYQVTVNATRLMIISPIFFALSSVFSGILNSFKKFIAYSLAPIIYNISIIFGILFLTDKFSNPVYGLVCGVLIGALFHALIQFPATLMTGFRFHFVMDFKKGEVSRIIKLMLPRTLAIGVNQINLLVDTIVASFFLGGITIINYANDVQTMPTVIFAISVATAIFPVLSENYAKEDKENFLKSFSWSARRILYFMIPATVGIVLLRAQIVRLIFGVGHFGWDATFWTTKALLFFAFGLVAQGLIPLLVKAFYAMQDTKTPLLVGILVMIVNAIFTVSIPFIKPLGLGVSGIAFAFSIAGTVNAILLFWLLHEKLGVLDKDNKIFESTFKLIFSSVIMGVLVYASLYFFDFFVDTHRALGLLAQTVGAVGIGSLTYFVLTNLFGCEEANFVIKKFKKVLLKT